ncbi:MAG: hypothetical protein VXZ60_01425 [Pseudomonadota bacterium]|nr:hypothetical protein [Pseudomonadota bacterium]
MPRKKNTFEKLALKEQIEMTKKARDVKLLHEELKNSELMKQQIDDALAQTPKNRAATTGNELKSGNWFVEKILEQRVTIQNKCDFLQNDATMAQEKLSAARRRHAKASDKASARRREIMLEKENKREADLPKRNIIRNV